MSKITKKTLDQILLNHGKWLQEKYGGAKANLQEADLQYAGLRGANLQEADLQYAGLRGANLQEADLHGANLKNADLRGASLQGADLRGASLQGADLRGASLQGADLTGANIFWTILNFQCPEEGSFIAWKKLEFGCIAKLVIPEDAKRSSATSRKCRASKATVMAIYNKSGEEISEGRSNHDSGFIYQVGETVHSDNWDEDRWNECSNGIHFFITRKEAEEY